MSMSGKASPALEVKVNVESVCRHGLPGVLHPPSFSTMETLDQHKGAGQADRAANPAALSLVPERVSALVGSL